MENPLKFDDIKLQEDGNIILILSGNKSPAYVEQFEDGLIKRGYGQIIREIVEGDTRYIYFAKELLPEDGNYFETDRRNL